MKTPIIALLLLFSTVINASDIYVSPSGSDSHPGTSAQPVRSITKALRIAREWRRWGDTRANENICIRLESGASFVLDEPLYVRPEDSGTAVSKTIITTTGQVKASISSAGAPQQSSRSLWSGGKKLVMAQHCVEQQMEPMLDFNVKDETITIPASSLLKHGIHSIADAPQLEMVVHQRWAIAILRVKDIQINGDKAILSFKNPESRWEFSHPWPQPIINGEKGSSCFYLRNARQFVNEHNEWYIDNGKVITPTEGDITAANLNRLVTIEGSAAGKVHDIEFRNITFEYAAWERPGRYGHVTLQGGFPIIDAYKLTEHEGLPWDSGLENQAWVARPESAVSISWADRIDFTGCTFQHLASTGLDYVIGCSDITVKDNLFTDIGGTALLCGSFAEGATEVHRPYICEPSSAYCERFTIEGNTVKDVTNEDWGCVGIGCGFVRDFTIERNDVSQLNYSGICVGWGWTTDPSGMRNNRIQYNKVYDYARQLYDAGGIYTLSNQPNSFIRYNEIGCPTDAPYATNDRGFYIYLDAKTDGYTVSHNTYLKGKGKPRQSEKIGYNHPGPSVKVEL